MLDITGVSLYSYLSYETCKSHPSCAVLDCRLWTVYHIFFSVLHSRHDFREKFIERIDCVLILFTSFI